MQSREGNPRLKGLMSSKKKYPAAAPGGPATNKAYGFAISATAFAVALLAASPQGARAASECGAEVPGADTITCSGASYATGISYPVTSGGLTLNLNNPGMAISGATGVFISQPTVAAGVNMIVNATSFGSINTTGTAIQVDNQTNSGSASLTMDAGSVTSTAAVASVLVGTQSLANAEITLNGGRVANTGAGGGLRAFVVGGVSAGNATSTITGGVIDATAFGAHSFVNGPLATGTARISMTGGSVLSSGGVGLWAQQTGRGLAQVQMTGGTVAATGANGDGIFAHLTRTGTYAVDVTGGTVTGGSGVGAAIHTSASAGGTVNIGAGATINAGASGVALRDGDADRNGVDEIGGNSVITTAGTLNGAVVLGGGTDTLTMTGGAINGNITGDGVDALNLNLGTNSFTHGAAYAISGMNGIVMNSGTVRLDGTVAANTLNVKGGMLTLGNTATITTTAVEGGTLSVNGTLTGAVNVLGGRLQGNGRVGNTTNFAGGTIAPGNSIGKLLIAGNYVGNGGTLEIEGVLGGTGSPADRLVITGNASGTTSIQTINTGGTGALTGSGNTDGISIVQVGGTSTASTFQLAGGYAAAGPYQYQLRMFDPATSAASQADPLLGAVPFYDYRLQSVVDASGRPVAVPQIAGYQAMPTGAVRYGSSLLDSVHKRQGELRDLAASRDSNSEERERAFFVRVNGSRSEVAGSRASGYDQDIDYLQAGGYVFGRDMEDGASLRIGGALSRGKSKLRVSASSAQVDLKGTTLALTSTYQTAAGWYLDGVAHLTDYSTSIQTRERGRVGAPDGLGLGLSLEGGYPMQLGGGLVVEPQAQLSYQKVKFDTFVDVDRITVDLQDGESLQGRVGARIKKAFNPNTSRQWTLYAEGNLVHEFLKDRGISASGVSFASDSLGTSAQLGGGIQAQLGANTTLFASVSFSKGLSSGAADTWSGNLGMRFAF